MDVRLLREKIEEENDRDTNTLACVEWAFAGKSHAEPQEARESGLIKLSHTIWDHWIDSKSDDPGVDEGDMWIQKDGNVLECGKQVHPDTGEEIEYEELWHDLEVTSFGKKQNRSSLVMRADDPVKGARGMAVKIGGFCQGILKTRNGLTVERWEHKSADIFQIEAAGHGGEYKGRTHNDWSRTFKVGEGKLPCEYMCTNTDGKIGLNTVLGDRIDNTWTPETEWKVVEEYYW